MIHKVAKLLGNFALFTLLMLYGSFALRSASAQNASTQSGATTAEEKSSASKMTDDQKIALAMSAAPAEIAKNATITDMATMKQLRAGSNGWVCYAPPMSQCA